MFNKGPKTCLILRKKKKKKKNVKVKRGGQREIKIKDIDDE